MSVSVRVIHHLLSYIIPLHPQFQAVMGLAGNFNVYDIRKEVRSQLRRTH